MAIKNSFIIYINGINLTHYTVVPLKWGNFLDEQLDEMYVSLRHGPFKNIKPLSPVEIHLKNERYYGSKTVSTKEIVKRFIVANDKSEESPIGSKKYNHELYLIELTKIAECFVVDTITFTNDLGRSYTQNASEAPHSFDAGDDEWMLDDYPPITPSNYKSPIEAGTIEFVSATKIFPYRITGSIYLRADNSYILSITDQNGHNVFYNEFENNLDGTVGEDVGFTGNLTTGMTYTVKYEWSTYRETGAGSSRSTLTATYTFVVVQNRYPLKKWTMKDVINRVLDLAEPIRKGETPRFRLNAAQAGQFDKIPAPQFSFTKSTLRECLQECGKIVHGEPRLDIAQDDAGTYYYEVTFDLWGQTEKSDIYVRPYIQKTVSQVIDSYASSLDSNAENLVNSLDKYTGVIVEPYAGGYKTVRTETMYVRITDENMLIPTQYPINTIEKVECGYIPNNADAATPPIDITPYIFESSIYNTQLSSYEDLYPYSKAYGIMYTQGQKNLTALNFKQEHPINDVFNRYAIINILREATGDESLDLSVGSNNENNYPLLAFRVTYTPFYNSRVGQTKVNYTDYPYGAALIYNQQANVIESRYYGENLKGTIARLGNVEKSVTYIMGRLGQVPKAGQMYNDEYYISAVSVEFMPTYIKCTIGLSKDYNRLSQYIGVSSVKRFSEVSQTQALERNLLYREYIVIGDSIDADSDSRIGNNLMSAIADTFTQTGDYRPLTNVAAWGASYQNQSVESEVSGEISADGTQIVFTLPLGYGGVMVTGTQTESVGGTSSTFSFSFTADTASYTLNRRTGGTITSFTIDTAFAVDYPAPLPAVYLPVIASAFGNSIAFSWTYEDNYSAGAVSQYAENGDVTGYFQNNYQYTDYYGRMYYYHFDLQEHGPQITESFTPEDITGQVTYQIASDGASVTFTIPNPNGYSVEVSGMLTETVSGSASSRPYSFTTTGTSYTLNRTTGGTITAVTVESATRYVPDFIDSQTEIGTALPAGEIADSSSGYFSTVGQQPYVLRKDNREKLQGNVQIDFVTNRQGLIIGSALASYCGAVRGSDSSLKAKLYVFDEPINKFADHLEASLNVDLSELTGAEISVSPVLNGRFSITAGNFTAGGKSWAIVTAQHEGEPETVEDEEGNIYQQTETYGGDVLLAQNMEISAGQAFTPIYFTKKRKIFKEDVWTANR